MPTRPIVRLCGQRCNASLSTRPLTARVARSGHRRAPHAADEIAQASRVAAGGPARAEIGRTSILSEHEVFGTTLSAPSAEQDLVVSRLCGSSLVCLDIQSSSAFAIRAVYHPSSPSAYAPSRHAWTHHEGLRSAQKRSSNEASGKYIGAGRQLLTTWTPRPTLRE